MVENPAHAAIVRSVVELGHNLALEVVGEGVETAEALDSLRATGCDLVQGFHLARPMTIAALRTWLVAADERDGERSPAHPIEGPQLVG